MNHKQWQKARLDLTKSLNALLSKTQTPETIKQVEDINNAITLCDEQRQKSIANSERGRMLCERRFMRDKERERQAAWFKDRDEKIVANRAASAPTRAAKRAAARVAARAAARAAAAAKAPTAANVELRVAESVAYAVEQAEKSAEERAAERAAWDEQRRKKLAASEAQLEALMGRDSSRERGAHPKKEQKPTRAKQAKQMIAALNAEWVTASAERQQQIDQEIREWTAYRDAASRVDGLKKVVTPIAKGAA